MQQLLGRIDPAADLLEQVAAGFGLLAVAVDHCYLGEGRGRAPPRRI
jgi:hypothetical protein